MKLTHLDENGAAHMVNIGAKPVTQREAVAQSVLTMQPETLRMILERHSTQGRCVRVRAYRGHYGGQADGRADSDVPSDPDRERGYRH